MRTDITYTNSRGEKLCFGGTDDSLHYMAHELRDWEWEYSTGRSGKVTSFSRAKKPKIFEFPVGIAAKTEKEGLELRNRVVSIGEIDVETRTPGTLSVGDWGMRCWIVGGKPDVYWLSDKFAEFILEILTDEPVWVKAKTFSFCPTSPEDQKKIPGLDFPHDFPYDFASDTISQVVSTSTIGSTDFLWRVHGPVVDPEVQVGKNLYKVNIFIPDRAYLEVDSRAKTVELIEAGSRKNFYAQREKGAPESGSYIFEKLPAGRVTVTWNKKFGFDLVVYETRSTPPYEE